MYIVHVYQKVKQFFFCTLSHYAHNSVKFIIEIKHFKITGI